MRAAQSGATRNTLWVGQQLIEEDKPYQHVVEGLGRALASEDYTRKFVSLLVDQSDTQRHIIGYIPRLVEKIEQYSVDALQASGSPNRRHFLELPTATRAALSLSPPGRREKPMYSKYEKESPSLVENEVIVRVAAFLNNNPSLVDAICQTANGQGLDVLIGCLEDYDLSDLSFASPMEVRGGPQSPEHEDYGPHNI
ncbi:uncharacterized protein BDW70DRAFT_155755 [Aspergillus foveolatus]|uniref:uncharacterized protein n=1 Tax=Aspergillus foveolatus TaxID=210207 RepID=UPI003CCD36E7